MKKNETARRARIAKLSNWIAAGRNSRVESAKRFCAFAFAA